LGGALRFKRELSTFGAVYVRESCPGYGAATSSALGSLIVLLPLMSKPLLLAAVPGLDRRCSKPSGAPLVALRRGDDTRPPSSSSSSPDPADPAHFHFFLAFSVRIVRPIFTCIVLFQSNSSGLLRNSIVPFELDASNRKKWFYREVGYRHNKHQAAVTTPLSALRLTSWNLILAWSWDTVR
jgi:hypothetical protein